MTTHDLKSEIKELEDLRQTTTAIAEVAASMILNMRKQHVGGKIVQELFATSQVFEWSGNIVDELRIEWNALDQENRDKIIRDFSPKSSDISFLDMLGGLLIGDEVITLKKDESEDNNYILQLEPPEFKNNGWRYFQTSDPLEIVKRIYTTLDASIPGARIWIESDQLPENKVSELKPIIYEPGNKLANALSILTFRKIVITYLSYRITLRLAEEVEKQMTAASEALKVDIHKAKRKRSLLYSSIQTQELLEICSSLNVEQHVFA